MFFTYKNHIRPNGCCKIASQLNSYWKTAILYSQWLKIPNSCQPRKSSLCLFSDSTKYDFNILWGYFVLQSHFLFPITKPEVQWVRERWWHAAVTAELLQIKNKTRHYGLMSLTPLKWLKCFSALEWKWLQECSPATFTCILTTQNKHRQVLVHYYTKSQHTSTSMLKFS